MVRAQRSSWRNSAANVSSGTVVSGMVGASRTARPVAWTSRPSALSSARCIDQRFEPADSLQRAPPQRHRGTEAVLPAHGAGEQGAGQKGMGDLGGAELGGQAIRGGQPGVERRDEAGRRLLQRADQGVQVVGPDVQVGIGDDQDVVPGGGQHVDEVADLQVADRAGRR